jgi:hypothetical protein
LATNIEQDGTAQPDRDPLRAEIRITEHWAAEIDSCASLQRKIPKHIENIPHRESGIQSKSVPNDMAEWAFNCSSSRIDDVQQERTNLCHW